MQREREVFHREKNEREATLRQELQMSWDQMQQQNQGETRRASVTAQTRRTIELQERKIDS